MSLITEMMEPCKIYNKIRQDDPYGSEVIEWKEGSSFNAAIIKNSTTEATIAEREGIKEIFTVVTNKGFHLEYHDVFKRVSDGAVFRVTSDSKDSEAPARSTVQIAKVTAERWELDAEDSGNT